ncbi:vegetative incompatibility protein HET-E-1 [Chaetomidium leptoderma]|uniref:Vegetative incompatibility protein HET-E-1 n=1 Tax=Chaetomidium leptoderma TaxID=669021 RepID=A0AAN6ZRW4_9PEZI|nr:vegetative incompatibility protein HET-E-1 [Chaetomidium leptoderma]
MDNDISRKRKWNHADVIHADGNSRVQVGDNYYPFEDSCLADLRSTEPRHDKIRIEQTKGGILRDAYKWMLDNAEFQRWRDDEQSRLLWIKGDPGKGKTMLLCGIINELDNSIGNTGILSFFFCQAADSRINSAAAVLRGLIYLLVEQEPFLATHVRNRYDHAREKLFQDANSWWALSEILTSMLEDPNLRHTFVIIDALDECVTDLPLLLEFIVAKSPVFSRVKWIVSSRNWPSIEKDLNTATQKVNLHLELNEASVSAAVTTYVQFKVEGLAERNGYSDDTRDAVERYLSTNAHGTFLWVALVCQELANTSGWEVEEILATFPPGLDALYRRMMNQVCNSRHAKLLQRILAVIAVVYRPLTLEELPALVDMPGGASGNHKALAEIVGLCGSFLALREHAISLVHQSAKDFVLKQAHDEIFPSGIEDIHRTIFSQSLRVMRETLRRDIYNLGHPGYPIDQVKQPEPDPLATAQYSCVYWVDHLHDCDPTRNAANDLKDDGSVDKFLRRSYLHWLEAVSLLRSTSEGIASLLRLEGLLQISQLAYFVRDGCRFIRYNKWAIENSPLQVYAAALIFSPTRSIIRNLFRNEEPRWIVTKPLVEDDWSACLQTLEGNRNPVRSVAWSHDAARLASASWDRTVKIWDATTGRCVATLEGHSNPVESVVWSPDAAQLASASYDHTVKIWDATTGRCIATLGGHSDSVKSVAWSHDAAWLASASWDKTVKIWDATTGRCIATLERHSRAVYSAAWSPDAARLASASDDKTVKIWDATTGQCIATLEGHSDSFDTSLSRRLHTDAGTFDLPPALPSTALAVTSANHIPSPASPQCIGYGLNSNCTWITYRGENLLWLPPEYRPSSSAISGTAVAIGCFSGRVWTVVLSDDNPISQQG